MRLNYIYIDGYKNLSKLEIELDSDSSMIGFIGNNGSGKSNVIEALTDIFSKIKSGMPVDFEFCVKYELDNKICEINNLDGTPVVLLDGKKVSRSKLVTVMPSTIFLYYCGETNRLKDRAHNFIDKEYENILKLNGETAFKYFTYISVADFGAALLSNYVFQNQTWSKIREIVKIDVVQAPIIVRLKKPYWSKSGRAADLWNATGAVREQLNSLISISPIRNYQIIGDSAEIRIDDISLLKQKWYSSLNLFMALKMLDTADILDYVDFKVRKTNGSVFFDYASLSEGEKQLCQLLSIMDITKEHRTLYLLDEFDSYLHPNWQRKFADILRSINTKGQVLFTTHSPLTLSKMNRDEIILLKDGKAISLSFDPYNRDAAEVLEELMEVGLRSDDISQLITDFKTFALQTKKTEALTVLEELKMLLSEDDPFFVSAQYYLARLG